VEKALSALEDGAVFADIGTGSGAVALAVLAHRPRAHALATDISEGAAAAARANAAALGCADRLRVAVGDLLDPFEPVAGTLDAVLSNPPYIRDAEIAGLPAEIRDHEPRAALAGGADGLDVVRRILERAPAWLRPGGFVAIEIGYDQGAAAMDAVRGVLGLGSAAVFRDLAGRDRALWAVRAQVI
jgi:release factor glutamine methyltransferase